MHIPPHENANRPIVDVDDAHVPLVYFNIVRLKAGEHFDYRVPGYETCVVPATGTVTVEAAGETFADIGNRGVDVWDGEPEGVYVPTDTACPHHRADGHRDLHRGREIRRDAEALRRAVE
jgi:5-deoxy-glucuronate isomerase